MLPIKTITVPLLLQVANPRLAGNDPRKTQSHMAQNHGVWSQTIERRSFIHMEEGVLSRTLAFRCDHHYTLEEYTIKRENQHLQSTWGNSNNWPQSGKISDSRVMGHYATFMVWSLMLLTGSTFCVLGSSWRLAVFVSNPATAWCRVPLPGLWRSLQTTNLSEWHRLQGSPHVCCLLYLCAFVYLWYSVEKFAANVHMCSEIDP